MSEPQRIDMSGVLERLERLRKRAPEPPTPLYRCRECLDEGLVATAEPNTYRPCHTCRAEQYGLWLHGRYATDRSLSPPATSRPTDDDMAERDRRRFGGRP